MAQRVLISTGGSGGHVVPATILYEHLKDKFHVFMSTDCRGMKFLDKNKYNLEIFNIKPIPKNIFLLPFHFFFKKNKNRYINFNRWLYVSTFVFSIKNFKY